MTDHDALRRRRANLRAIAHRTPARLFTIEHVAELLDTSSVTVDRLLAAGELRRVRIGVQAVRVRADDLAAFIDRHTEDGHTGDGL